MRGGYPTFPSDGHPLWNMMIVSKSEYPIFKKLLGIRPILSRVSSFCAFTIRQKSQVQIRYRLFEKWEEFNNPER